MLQDQTLYLRLFVDESTPDPVETNLPGLTELVSSFASLTGWKLGYCETISSQVRRQDKICRDVPIQGRLVIDDLADEPIQGISHALPRDKCERLAAAVNRVLEDLDHCREEIWRKNAELATGIPVSDDGTASEKLAVLLQSILRSAVDVTNARRAALYLLDDGTEHLNLRTQVGFGPNQTIAESRELSGAKADLEALLGHAVAMEDSEDFGSWGIPGECAAALCVPISSASNLLGTLWVFDDRSRPFSGTEANMIEIIAGRIAAELERSALLLAAREEKQASSAATSVSIARPHLPNIPPPIDELQIRGMVGEQDSVTAAGAVYDWSICQRGRLAFLAAYAGSEDHDAARVVTILQTAFRAHSGKSGSALELFDAVFETGMSVGSGDSPVRFTCGYLEPNSGLGELASTEQVPGAVAVIGDEFQVRLETNAEPLGEFGLAYGTKFSLDVDEELVVSISEQQFMEPILDNPYDELGFIFDSDDAFTTVAVEESTTLVGLRIKRVR